MNERENLLRAICADPDDDTVRLAFADWLEEHGEPERAEFIRKQIEATRFPPGDPKAAQLRARVVDLAKRYGQHWCGDGRVFVRGFTAAAFIDDLNQVPEQADNLFSRNPIHVLYSNEFWRGGGNEADVVSCRHFGRLTGLGSHSRGWDGDRVALALTNPYLANLRMLDFNNGQYNRTGGARGIAAATHLTNLIVLDLTGNEIGNEGLEALAGARHLASLRALRLGMSCGDGTNEITEQGVAALARSTCFPALTQLVLDGNEIGSEGLEHILRAEWAGNLTELNLANTFLSEAGLVALARSRRLTNLRRLDVAANGINETVAGEFLRSDSFPNLIDLHLVSRHVLEDPLTEATEVALRERFGANVIRKEYHAPVAICIEDKIRWRMQTLNHIPADPTEDCEAV